MLRFAGMALEMGSGIAGFTLIGWWVDHALGTNPRYLLTGAILGVVGGMYYMIRSAFLMDRQMRDATRKRNSNNDDRKSDDKSAL